MVKLHRDLQPAQQACFSARNVPIRVVNFSYRPKGSKMLSVVSLDAEKKAKVDLLYMFGTLFTGSLF